MLDGHDNGSSIIQQIQFNIGCGGPWPYKGGNSHTLLQDFDSCSMRQITIGQCLQKIWIDGQDHFGPRTAVCCEIVY